MSQPTPTVFYIAVFREDQTGPQHKVLTSISGLVRFVEGVQEDHGPFDVYVVNVESLECARYDLNRLALCLSWKYLSAKTVVTLFLRHCEGTPLGVPGVEGNGERGGTPATEPKSGT